MKVSVYILLMLMPVFSAAQNYQGMSEGDMQNMMQQMQKVQACMGNIDQSKLKSLEQRSKQISTKIESLCTGGKRDEAQETAITMGKEMMADPDLQEMRKCGEMMKGMMPQMMPQMSFMDEDKDLSSQHICD